MLVCYAETNGPVPGWIPHNSEPWNIAGPILRQLVHQISVGYALARGSLSVLCLLAKIYDIMIFIPNL